VIRFAVALALLLLLVACSHGTATSVVHIRTSDGTVSVRARIADTDSERSTGLSGEAHLAPDAGMAFLFPGAVRVGFWMKDTLIPLSIAFWGTGGRIVSIMDMQPCPADPCPSFWPTARFVGALEVNRGFLEDHGVEVGDRVELGPS
jgi:uncharacterized membrane protein (UPF0127 family)